MSSTGTKAWREELRRVSRLASAKDVREYGALVSKVTGRESRSCFQALIDSIVVADDHGAYEAVHNALWRFPPRRFARWMAAALPGLLRRMEKHDQVQRFLSPLVGRATESHLPLVVAAVEGLGAKGRRPIVAGVRRWARREALWDGVLARLAPQPRRQRPRLLFAVPPRWPPRWKSVLAHEERDAWEVLAPDDAMGLVTALLLEPDSGDLALRFLRPLFFPPRRSAWLQRVAARPEAERKQIRAALRRLGRSGAGSPFAAREWQSLLRDLETGPATFAFPASWPSRWTKLLRAKGVVDVWKRLRPDDAIELAASCLSLPLDVTMDEQAGRLLALRVLIPLALDARPHRNALIAGLAGSPADARTRVLASLAWFAKIFAGTEWSGDIVRLAREVQRGASG